MSKNLRSAPKSLRTLGRATTGIGLLTVAIISLNVISQKAYFRLDVTQDKVFSLSSGTKNILAKLDRDVKARLFFTRSQKDLPPVLKTYATRVEEVLNEYKSHANGHLTVEVIDPRPDTEDEEMAQKYGLSGVRLPRGDQMYFGVVLTSGAKEVVIPYLDPRREEFLEYDLSEAVLGTIKKERPKIGVLSALPVMGGPRTGEDGGEPWVLLSDLKRNFEVEEVPVAATEIKPDLKALLIIHPKNLSEATLFAIDQYVLGGGRVVAAVDPMSRVDMASAGPQGMGQPPSSDLGPLLAAWGVDYSKEILVGDFGHAAQINAGGSVLAYPYFVALGEDAFATSSVITGTLKQVLFAEGGEVKAKPDSGFTFEPLIKTSKDSGTVNSMMAGYSPPDQLASQLKPDGKERVLAALVRGKFKTAFPNGRPAAASTEQKAPPSGEPLKEAKAETQIVVVADVDFLADQNAADKFRFGNQVMVRVRNDNLNFVLNAVDYLGGSEDLIAIRSRGRIARPFTRVAELQKNAQLKWQAEEEKLTAQLNDLQKRLSELQQQRTDGNRLVLSQQQQDEINRFRDDEVKIKGRRREVRKSLREDIEALGHRLIAANMLIVPVMTSAFGAFVFRRRASRRKDKRHG